MKRDDFFRWFKNRDFWRAFRRLSVSIPLPIPETPAERQSVLEGVYEAIRSAQYSPGIPAIEIVTNKGFGVARTIPVFRIEDYCVYYFCVKELEDVLCSNRVANTFGGWRLGGQLPRAEHEEISGDPEYGRYSFNPMAWSQAFGEFNSILFSQLQQGRYSHVLQFDMSNFYDSIRLDILERWIREEASSEKGWIIALLFYLLNQWNRRNTGLHPQSVGLPMDALADCSRLLANYYLQRYDRFAARLCEQSGCAYLRYSDDQMILLNDTDRVDKLMLLLTRRLDRYGLRVNQKKTQLWTSGALAQHRFIKLQSVLNSKAAKQDSASVNQFVEEYLRIPVCQLGASWNGGVPLLNRLIFANLESLPTHMLEEIFGRLTTDEYLLAATEQRLSRLHQLNAKRARPMDFPAHLKVLADRCVHNGFHYEVLAFAKAVKNAELVASISVRISELDAMMHAEEV